MTSGATVSAAETAYARKTRARILTAAEKRFMHYGFAKTTIVDIADVRCRTPTSIASFATRPKSSTRSPSAGSPRASACARMSRRGRYRRRAAPEFVVELHCWKRREHLRDSRTHDLLTLASYNGRPFVSAHQRALAGILVEISEDGNHRGEFRVADPATVARIIQDATVKFCDPRLVEQYRDEPLEDQARAVMRVLVDGLSVGAAVFR